MSQSVDPMNPRSIGEYLAHLQVIMVNTTLPANIGSAARAMHTMGLSRLTVVDPKHPIDDTSVSHAAGGIAVLEAASITPTLDAAVADCQLVFAASSRSRHMPRPVVNPTEAADIMLSFIDAQNAQGSTPNIAILFGREDRGLTNDELALADYHIQIDANPEYPVLNVASAIQVIASFIFARTQAHVSHTDTPDNADDTESGLTMHIRQQWDEPAITHAEQAQLVNRVIDLMVDKNLADAGQLKSLPARLSRLSARLQLDKKEYQLLSALIAKLK
ncbi:RNA methyltransferase [Psychrobacter aestuarii]|uniref:tRNA (cytidine/uridine-2'-O-)-methyltransferase TrmJ n=1 Tax=Psychrobacter aestuarii TaxID=556327 RepID=A0ABN0VSM1_9GAMM|nr:TrmJ/YjtD family RNA methyltransferase [Psychrobacter aestuarii]